MGKATNGPVFSVLADFRHSQCLGKSSNVFDVGATPHVLRHASLWNRSKSTGAIKDQLPVGKTVVFVSHAHHDVQLILMNL